MRKTLLIVWILVLLLTACAPKNGVEVSQTWARPGLNGGTSAIYLTLQNNSASEDALLSAECEAAMQTELHESKMDASGTMQMMPQEKIILPANGKVELKPGGLHIMLMGLKNDLKPGDEVSVTLTFEKAATQKLSVKVQQP